jgi:hypothetical protein
VPNPAERRLGARSSVPDRPGAIAICQVGRWRPAVSQLVPPGRGHRHGVASLPPALHVRRSEAQAWPSCPSPRDIGGGIEAGKRSRSDASTRPASSRLTCRRATGYTTRARPPPRTSAAHVTGDRSDRECTPQAHRRPGICPLSPDLPDGIGQRRATTRADRPVRLRLIPLMPARHGRTGPSAPVYVHDPRVGHGTSSAKLSAYAGPLARGRQGSAGAALSANPAPVH